VTEQFQVRIRKRRCPGKAFQ